MPVELQAEKILKGFIFRCTLEADPVSAFGGILITNQEINLETARGNKQAFLRSSYIARGF